MNNNPSNEASIEEELRNQILLTLNGHRVTTNKNDLIIAVDPELTDDLLALFAHHTKEYALQLLQRVEDEAIGEDKTVPPIDTTWPPNLIAEWQDNRRYINYLNNRKKEQREAIKRIRTSIEKGE